MTRSNQFRALTRRCCARAARGPCRSSINATNVANACMCISSRVIWARTAFKFDQARSGRMGGRIGPEGVGECGPCARQLGAGGCPCGVIRASAASGGHRSCCRHNRRFNHHPSSTAGLGQPARHHRSSPIAHRPSPIAHRPSSVVAPTVTSEALFPVPPSGSIGGMGYRVDGRPEISKKRKKTKRSPVSSIAVRI